LQALALAGGGIQLPRWLVRPCARWMPRVLLAHPTAPAQRLESLSPSDFLIGSAPSIQAAAR